MPLYLHDEANAMRFKVQGNLGGSCVTELENSWRTASSVLRGKALLLDITQVTSIDEAGRELLARMQREGAQLITRPQVGGLVGTGVLGERAAANAVARLCRLLQRVRDLLRVKAHEGA